MPETALTTTLRRARWGVVILFFVNGVGWASILPRYPEIKARLALSDGWWGLVAGVGPVGGLAAGLLTAALMRRFTSAKVACAAQALGLIMLNLAANAPVPGWFSVGLFCMSGLDALCDIAMNAHGLRVQRGYGRSILNSFHAWWSVGAISGGLIGSTCLQLGVPVGLQTVAVSLLFFACSAYSYTLLLHGKDPEPPHHQPHAHRKISLPILLRLVALGCLGASGNLIEDIGGTWSSIYIERSFEVIPFVVGLGFVALQGTEMIARFTGDWLVNRVGYHLAVLQGAVITSLGMGLALTFPSAVGTILGFACTGWGVATVVPATMHAADELPGLPMGTGLTIVTWMMRLGLLVSPPLVGLISQATLLRWGLLTIPATAVLILILSPALRAYRSR